MSFEPFHDYDQINPEQAHSLKEALAKYRKATDDLLTAHTADREVVCAKRVLEAHEEINEVMKGLNKDTYTVPAMIHTAGEVQEEIIEELGDLTLHVQRCERCGSVLKVSHYDSGDNFLDIGDRVAKKSSRRRRLPARGGARMNERMAARMELLPDIDQMYFVGDRELEDYELECVSLKNIFEED